MSRKHDKSVDDEQSANLLLTGPIAIRGLGRGVKEALVRGRPSRHRAFAGDDTEQDVDPTPLQQMLAGGPTVSEAGPSSDLAARADTQADDAGVPQDDQEHDRAENVAVPGDLDAAQPGVGDTARFGDTVDDWLAPADAAGAQAVDRAEASLDGEGPAEQAASLGGGRTVEAQATETTPTETTPTAEEPSDDFDALPVEEPGDGVEAEEHHSVVDSVGEQPTAGEVGVEIDREGPEDEPEAPALDGDASDGVDARTGEDRRDIVEPQQQSPLPLSDEPHPVPDAMHEVRAAEVEHSAEALPEEEATSEERAASKESWTPAPDGGSGEEPSGSEQAIETLEAERAVGDERAREQPEVVLPGGFEGDPSVAGAAEGFIAPDSAAVDDAEAPTEPTSTETTASEGSDASGEAAQSGPDGQAALEQTSTDEQEADARSDLATEPEHRIGDEHRADGAIGASEPPSGDDQNDAETTGTADESELHDEGAALAEIDPSPDEDHAARPDEAAGAVVVAEAVPVDERVAVSQSQLESDALVEDDAARESAPDPESEPVPQTERPASDGEQHEQGQSAASPEGRPWVTAEELFRLPLPAGRQGGVGGNGIRVPEGASTGGEELQEPEELVNEVRAEQGPESEGAAAAVAAPEQNDPEHEPRESVGALTPQPEDSAVAAAAPVLVAATESRPRPPRTETSPLRPDRLRPLRERFGREAIGIAVLVVLALICAGLITAVVIKTRHDAAIAASEAAHYTPPPLATPQPTKTGPAVAVIGDGSTSSAASGVSGKQRWPSVLASSLGGTVSTHAASGMGYAAKSTSGETFVQAAGKVPSDAKVVVFFGGAADTGIAPLSLAKAATSAFAAAKQQAPDAKIVVVGPAVAAGAGATDLATIRDTLRGAALVVKATWADPIDKGWMPAAKQMGSPSDLSVSDEKTLASKMQAVVTKAMG